MSSVIANHVESPYQQLYRDSVAVAHRLGASDIHIEPTGVGVDIRFRVNGDMLPPWKQFSSEHRSGFLLAVKKAANLAIGVSGRPQDSRCTVEGVPVDLRVSLLPTLFGEKVVLRLLDTSKDFGLETLSLPADTVTDLMAALYYRNGVVLISGPTGSGKTTTLYSMLCALDRTRKNIVTLEDPVEYTIAGINQVRIGGKISFGGALRAVLRQDPDVILVGEIRDEETAGLAFKAAATGHLVLSTVHANSAIDVIGRLLNLGVDRDTLKDNLRFSAAQRLIGKVCEACAMPAQESIASKINSSEGELFSGRLALRQRNLRGCRCCREGLTGRIPVIEYMTEGGVTRFLNDGRREGAMKRTLKEAAYQLAVSGLIDIREATAIA